MSRPRDLVAVVLLEFWPQVLRMLTGRRGYLAVRNRLERLSAAPDGHGFRCDWQWTSDLRAARALPALGRALLARALADHPIRLASGPPAPNAAPALSFVIGHRGREREPLLQLTLRSLAAQDTPIEAVVVEQSSEVDVRDRLPAWVRYVHAECAREMPYNRAWAFNVGARHARAPVLILHDSDLLVPVDYAATVLQRVAAGWDLVNLKRFLFFMPAAATDLLQAGAGLARLCPDTVMQNAQGGGSLAITAAALASVGGLDEGFVGWGGEDNELWERCAGLRRWEYGCLSLVHLWHAAQPRKAEAGNPTFERYRRMSVLSAEERIRRLVSAPRGEATPRATDPFADVMEAA